MTSTPGNHEPPKTSTDKVWYNLRMVRFLSRYCLFWPSANWSRSHDSFSILDTLFCTLQPYEANSRIAIKQDTRKQNRVASCKLRKTDSNKIFLAYFLAADFSHLCAFEQSDAAMKLQYFFYTYWIWLLFCTFGGVDFSVFSDNEIQNRTISEMEK